MSTKYRVVSHEQEIAPGAPKIPVLRIHQAHHDTTGKAVSISPSFVAPVGDSKADLAADLSEMMKALYLPILSYSTFQVHTPAETETPAPDITVQDGTTGLTYSLVLHTKR